MNTIIKTLFVLNVLLLVHPSFGKTINLDVETRDPDLVCKNTRILEGLVSPYIDMQITGCLKEHISTSYLGNKDYLVKIEIETTVEKCFSQNNQAISFPIPTNTYYHWNPPMRFTYIDKIIDELGFSSEFAVSNIGPTSKPRYKQIVIIPECAFKK